MKQIIILLSFLLPVTYSLLPVVASAQVYEKQDSVKIVSLLAKAPKKSSANELMIYFGKALVGVPYVAQTLEKGDKENLIVNLRELDCTTFIENVMALTLCAENGKKTFQNFTNYIRRIRYHNGVVSYPTRLHYFSTWIEEGTKNGFVSEMSSKFDPFTGVQTLKLDFMSKHPGYYPALSKNPSMVSEIIKTEKGVTGKQCRYIPKNKLNNNKILKKYIKSGDIIAIVTNKTGLDTSHLGIALWHKDGTLHLLNASQIHKKVIDEPMTLYTYMQKHPIQIGIRVISLHQ